MMFSLKVQPIEYHIGPDLKGYAFDSKNYSKEVITTLSYTARGTLAQCVMYHNI